MRREKDTVTVEVHPEINSVDAAPRMIAVLRALQLGDLLCAVPAWRALRSAYPQAHIALIGLPWAHEFVTRFHRYFDEFIEFPGYPGLPERVPDFSRLPEFFAAMQARRFDLLIQMQGNGRYANGLVFSCGARKAAGFYAPPEACPDPEFFLPYPEGLPEIRRHLELMTFLGVPPQGEQLEFPLTPEDDAAFRDLDEAAELVTGSYVCLHAGGRRPAHRWTPERFARVADRLAAEGVQPVLTGTRQEQAIGQAVMQAMQSRPVNFIGRTNLGALGVLLSRARLLLSNDTGVSHMAAALRIPSVILCIGSDPLRWSPLDRHRHRVLVGRDTSADTAWQDVRRMLDCESNAAVQASPGEQRCHSNRTSAAPQARRRLRVLTWHVHGNYLYYLSQTPHDFFLPVGRPGPGYAGCAAGFPWPPNLHEVSIADVPRTEFDCLLFQSNSQYLVDQYELLTAEQRALPRLYLEHDPPQEHPTNTLHPVDDPDMLLVHVTHFNRLMWNSRRTPTCVIEHGVLVPPDLAYTGEWDKGLVIVNHLERRGRRLGADLFDYVRSRVPLDLVGMDSVRSGGLGEIGHERLPELMCRYRFVFHPIRYTSLGLALCEAMALGVPPVALATTEMPTVIQQDVSGYLDTDVDALVGWMQHLLSYPEEAHRIGAGAMQAARTRFGIERFAHAWDMTLTRFVADRHRRRGTAAGIHTHTEVLG
jgi:ADP-heptose:LPS heptosyltransferase